MLDRLFEMRQGYVRPIHMHILESSQGRARQFFKSHDPLSKFRERAFSSHFFIFLANAFIFLSYFSIFPIYFFIFFHISSHFLHIFSYFFTFSSYFFIFPSDSSQFSSRKNVRQDAVSRGGGGLRPI